MHEYEYISIYVYIHIYICIYIYADLLRLQRALKCCRPSELRKSSTLQNFSTTLSHSTRGVVSKIQDIGRGDHRRVHSSIYEVRACVRKIRVGLYVRGWVGR